MPRKVRPIATQGNIAFVTLTRGYVAVIDAADVPLVEGRSWQAFVAQNTVYATSKATKAEGGPRSLRMHRVILCAPDGIEVDHIHGDGLNNRRGNLRLATVTQNRQNVPAKRFNTSGHKGVSWDAANRKWRAQIVANGVTRCLGRFASKGLAAEAYQQASAVYHGEFGRPE